MKNRLEELRKQRGLKQEDLAKMIGVYQKDISRWENGERLPSLEIFAEICKALNVSADLILEIRKE